MAITVTGSTLTVTLTNATDLELGGHLTWTDDNTYDVGASGASRARTGYFGTSLIAPLVTGSTSVVTPLLANAGTLALSATGANVVTVSTNGVERVRVDSSGNVQVEKSSQVGVADTVLSIGNTYPTSNAASALVLYGTSGGKYNAITGLGDGRLFFFTNASSISAIASSETPKMALSATGNLLIGTTTDDGASKLQVAGTITGYSQTIYNPTATTGVTSAVIRAGAGQGSAALTTWQNNAGTTIGYVSSAGIIASSVAGGNSGILLSSGETTNYYSTGIDLSHGGTSRWYVFKTNNAAADLYVSRYNDAGSLLGTPLSITRANGYVSLVESGSRIGFFGVTPVVRQTATDLATVLTALANLGLIN